MRVWELKTTNKVRINCENFSQIYYKYFDTQFIGAPVKEWGSIVMKITQGNEEVCDAPNFVSGKPIFSQRAVEVLHDIINPFVEVLPVIHELYPVHAINVVNVVDCIDYSNSIKDTLSDGTFTGFSNYAFKKELVENQHMFKIPEKLRGPVFVSDEFRQTVIENKLTGFAFKELWNSELILKPVSNSEHELDEAQVEGVSFQEAMIIIEGGEKAALNGKVKWQKNKNRVIVLGHLQDDGSYVWIKPVYIPIPHLSAKWLITDKS
ncbi:imm11 family protein [Paenibacillus sp. CF384]|uniref:imm11 family protein n=1 Tax=Paenibacillus sp. CF384 TaxID=1884382 RepID=UPI00089742A8|nr:DUF1629 domain-containing protein [Paenibacillus sp. CF384]SDX72209.1 hypothetical protein SAMN05518855_1019123 [Paenibacillus sp. CF384]